MARRLLMTRVRHAVATFCAAVSASPAVACTLCHSDTAEQVRAAVLADIWSNALLVAAHFPVLATAIVAMARAPHR